MPVQTKNKSIFFKIISFVVVGTLILSLILVFARIRASTNPVPLPDQSFISKIEPRTYIKLDKTQGVYHVLSTYSKLSEPVFSCVVDITSAGERKLFRGFISDYKETDCRIVKKIQSHYECRLKNFSRRFTTYKNSFTIPRINASGQYDIPLSRFYTYATDRVAQTQTSYSFTHLHQLNEAFDVTINCKNSAGKPIVHTQLL